ncbi:TPA: hypothetical protein SMF36_000344 [Serratia marcescens]|nr:hypothetical protein [Serratia marcescens]HEJ6977283.1 hypothetical protein [Serratia marcescens]
MTEVLTYEALKAKCDRLEQINAQTLQVKLTMPETIKELTDRVERLSGMLTESRVATKSAEERADALAQRVEMLAQNLGNAIWGEQEALQRVNALAVENQALKNQEPKAWYIQICGGSVTTDPDEARMWLGVPLVRTDIETPATDAALAAIQAQGVEKLIKLKMEQLASMHPDTHAFGATAESLRAQINELQAFATELREAK